MLPKSLIRVTVAKQYPQLDRFQLTRITDKIHSWAYSESDLTPWSIEGAVRADLRHHCTTYEEDLRSHDSQYFGGARKHFQEIAHKTLKLKYGV